MSSYGYSKNIPGTFDDIVKRTTEALAREGFGVLTTINIKEKFKEKLSIDYEEYLILGACNPSQAHKALGFEKELGLLLPCNVIVYQSGNDVVVSAMRPTIAMGFIGNGQLDAVAQDVEVSLKRVIDSL